MRWFFALLIIFFTLPVHATEPRVQKILDTIDDLYRSDTSHGKVEMHVETEHFARTMELEIWSKGKEHSFIKILAPKKEKGTATLKVENDIWNYLPKVNRTIKVPSSMMASAWMGSHFTNDDLVKQSRYTEDYDCETASETADVIEIACTPKDDAVIIWGRVNLDIEKKRTLPEAIRFFDEDFNLARTLTFKDVKHIGGKPLPTILHMVPSDKPKESTTITYKELEFGVTLKKDLFSIRTLQQK